MLDRLTRPTEGRSADFEADYEPCESDVLFYEEHGWFATPRIVPDEVLEEAAYGLERYHAGERDAELPLGGGFLDWQQAHGAVLRLNDYVSLQCREFEALVAWPTIGRAAAKLLRTESVRLFHDQLVVKPAALPGLEGVVGWHTDRAYWKSCSSNNLLTAWIPLQDCTVEMGALTVVDGSHRWTNTAAMTTFIEREMSVTEERFFPKAEVERVTLTLSRGQVSFHHADLVHGSPPNLSDRIRAAMTVHIQDGANHYMEHVDPVKGRSLHINDLLCRRLPDGNPDYADPAICPVLWPKNLEERPR